MKTFSEKLKEQRLIRELSQLKLANRCKEIDKRGYSWTQSRIANYEKGNRTPDLEDVRVMSIALSIQPEFLAFDKNFSVEDTKSTHYYPVLNSVQAGLWTGISDQNSEEGFEMLASHVKASATSFFLRVKGESMLPEFKNGDLVLVDPNVQPTPGRFVVAINGSDEATFKQYKETGEFDEFGNAHFELIPLNSVFPTLSSKIQPIRIIGVAVEKHSKI